MCSSSNKTFGCSSKIFGFSNKKFNFCPNFVAVTKHFFFRVLVQPLKYFTTMISDHGVGWVRSPLSPSDR